MTELKFSRTREDHEPNEGNAVNESELQKPYHTFAILLLFCSVQPLEIFKKKNVPESLYGEGAKSKNDKKHARLRSQKCPIKLDISSLFYYFLISTSSRT